MPTLIFISGAEIPKPVKFFSLCGFSEQGCIGYFIMTSAGVPIVLTLRNSLSE